MAKLASRHNIYDERGNPDFNSPDQVLFLGDCMGVRLVPRGPGDDHICFEILAEDDENWFVKGSMTDSGWIDEMIAMLQAAKRYLKTQQPDMHEGRQYGWNFRRKK
jgi:hypothetical protein